MTTDLQTIITKLQETAARVNSNPTNRVEVAQLKQDIIDIQDLCQYAFLSVKLLNRSMN